MDPLKPDEVRAIREKFGLTQAELAQRLGITKPHGNDAVRAWESGKRPIPGPASLALRLVSALHDAGKASFRAVLDGLWRGA